MLLGPPRFFNAITRQMKLSIFFGSFFSHHFIKPQKPTYCIFFNFWYILPKLSFIIKQPMIIFKFQLFQTLFLILFSNFLFQLIIFNFSHFHLLRHHHLLFHNRSRYIILNFQIPISHFLNFFNFRRNYFWSS